VTVSNAVTPWTLQMPAGSQQQWDFVFTTTNENTGQSSPYSISGARWWDALQTTATGSQLFNVTTSATSYGQLVVTSSASLSQVQLTINPAATSTLTPNVYAHALWMNPGTVTAFTWLTGNLIVVGNPQP
jgi:hypothetical protein